MWTWFNCYLSGRHDYGVSCEPGAIFLRCVHCGKRSSGITVDARIPERPSRQASRPARANHVTRIAAALAPVHRTASSRVLPFTRPATR